MRILAVVVLNLAVGLPAFGSDGKLEINQSCALNGGCFPGDTGGFPVTIGALAGGRSFVLTSDLDTSPDADVSAILTFEGDFSLDLNGFTVSGPVTCTGSGSSLGCEPGDGLGINGSGDDNITVRNGRVTGFGGGGVVLGNKALVENVSALGNGSWGIVTNGNSVVRDSIASRNANEGIAAAGVVEGCVADSNLLNGIRVSSTSSVTNSVSRANGMDGIRCQLAGCSVAQNSVSDNEQDGIEAPAGSIIEGNSTRASGRFGILGLEAVTVRGNSVEGGADDGIECSPGCTVVGNSSAGNAGRGISADEGVVENNTVRQNGEVGIEASGSMIRGNLVVGNSGVGLVSDSGAGFAHNVINGNDADSVFPLQVSGSPNQMGSNVNVCGGSTFCPSGP